MVNTIRDADGRGVNLAVYGVTKIKKNEPELPEFEPVTYGALNGLLHHYLRSEMEPGRLNLQIRIKLKDKGEFVRKCRELQYRLRHCFVTFKKEEGMEYELTQSGGVKIEQLGEASAVLTIPFTYEIWGNTVEVPVTELNQVVQIAGAKPTDLELKVTLVSPVPELYVLNIMGVTLTQIVTSQPITISKTMALRNGITIPRFPTGVGETVVQISGSVLNQPLSQLSQIVSSLILRYRARW